MADPFTIETVELKKDYNGVQAVRDLNLQVPAGSIFGFLGRNGTGKTTTIKSCSAWPDRRAVAQPCSAFPPMCRRRACRSGSVPGL